MDEPMRLLIMHWGRTNAGPRLTRDIARSLGSRHRTEIFLTYSSYSDSNEDFEAMGVSSLPVRTYRSAVGLLLALVRAPLTAWRLWRFVRRNRIECIVTTMFNPLQIVVLSMMRSVPVIALIHDGKAHAGDLGVYDVLLGLEVRRASVLLVMSGAVREALRSRFPRATIEQTVHGAFVPRSQDRTRRSQLTVGMFGRLGAYQGVDVFCEAVRLISPKVDFTAVVAGNGSDDVRDLAVVHPEIRWDLRWIPEGEADQIVASFDVIALPYREASQSGVFALALGLGVPVVASPAGGLVEQIASTGAGLLAKDMSVHSFAAVMLQVLEDDDLRTRLRAAAVTASLELTWDRTADDILRIARALRT